MESHRASMRIGTRTANLLPLPSDTTTPPNPSVRVAHDVPKTPTRKVGTERLPASIRDLKMWGVCPPPLRYHLCVAFYLFCYPPVKNFFTELSHLLEDALLFLAAGYLMARGKGWYGSFLPLSGYTVRGRDPPKKNRRHPGEIPPGGRRGKRQITAVVGRLRQRRTISPGLRSRFQPDMCIHQTSG
jgi:hypothetical protein